MRGALPACAMLVEIGVDRFSNSIRVALIETVMVAAPYEKGSHMPTIAKLMAASLFLSTTLAAADTPTPAPAPTDAQPKPKKICRSVVVTGSIMPNRVCKTKEEWAAINAQRIDVTDRSKDAGRVPAGRESLGQ